MKEYSIEEKVIIVNLINKMQHAIREFKEINGKEPNNEELSTFMNKPIEKIIQNSNLLKDKELEIINLRFGIENEKMFSISEISEKLDITKSFTRICIVRILNLIDNPERVKTTRKVLDNMHKYMKGN